MKLRNNFSTDTRELFRDHQRCYDCGVTSGLTLHHICSRVSASCANASVLCQRCHEKVGHTQEERKRYFDKTQRILKRESYKYTTEDYKLMENFQ